jgi:hypothetical protein
MEDAVLIGAHRGSTFDSLVIRKDNKVMRCIIPAGEPRNAPILIGSKTHKAKFPIHINTQLFLHGTLLQSLDFDMQENTILTFYNSNACSMEYDSTNTSHAFYERKDKFYLDVQDAISGGVFIDSSRSEIACWITKRMTENYDWLRCTKHEGLSVGESSATCTNL